MKHEEWMKFGSKNCLRAGITTRTAISTVASLSRRSLLKASWRNLMIDSKFQILWEAQRVQMIRFRFAMIWEDLPIMPPNITVWEVGDGTRNWREETLNLRENVLPTVPTMRQPHTISWGAKKNIAIKFTNGCNKFWTARLVWNWRRDITHWQL